MQKMNPVKHPHVRKFILDALHPNRALPESSAAMQMQPEDWDDFSRLAKMHRLSPMLHAGLLRDDLAEIIPQSVKDQMKASHRRHALRNLNIYRELVNVTRFLDAAGIPSIALKGAFLAQFAYAEPGLRPMRDLDFLLRPEQAIRAFELLEADGYRSLFAGSPDAYFADRIHLPPLSSTSGITIELHHRLTEPGAHSVGFENELWVRCISKIVGGTQIKFLRAEDLLLHLCIHASLDHQLDLGPLALLDVALLVEATPIDWQDFMTRVSGSGWQRPVLPLLYLAKLHLGANIPDEIIRALGGEKDVAAWLDAAEHLLFSDPEEHKLLDYDVQELLYAGSIAKRFSTLGDIIFPPRTTIARHFPVCADSPRAYLYYPKRWYRMLFEKLPALLKAHAGRKQSMRELAVQRSVLSKWLEG